MVEDLASKKNCTPAQISLAWVLAQGNVVAIPRMRQIKHLHDNVCAADIQLSENDLQVLDRISKEAAPIGERYSPAAMQIYNFTQ